MLRLLKLFGRNVFCLCDLGFCFSDLGFCCWCFCCLRILEFA